MSAMCSTVKTAWGNCVPSRRRRWRNWASLSRTRTSQKAGITTTLTSMLDRMESANLIYRDRGDKDRRKILIFLTEEAKGLEQEYNEVTEEISNIYYKEFSEEEIEQVENYLHRILKNVEDVL